MGCVTTVIHIRDAPPDWQLKSEFVYIGRAGKGLSGEYGNEHPVGWCSFCSVQHARGEAVQAHRVDVRRRLLVDPAYRSQLELLRGKTLVCFCKPRSCHGDTYVEFLEGTL